jgi:carboxyl-terminal processing protease
MPQMRPTGPSSICVLCTALLVALTISPLPATPRLTSASRWHPDITSPQPSTRLSPKSRTEIFDKVGKEIEEHYYDPTFNGVDWEAIQRRYSPEAAAAKTDQEFYAVLSRMTSELHDAHTRFNSPEQWKIVKKQQGVGAGFSIDQIDGQIVVTSVRPRSSAADAGIVPGMVLISIDGQPVSERLSDLQRNRPASSSERATQLMVFARLLAGPASSTLKVTLLTANGAKWNLALERQVYSIASKVTSERLPSGNGYIRFDSFDPSTTREFREALSKFRTAPGVVIDLRRNGGGDLSVLMPIAGYFFDKKTLFAKDATRSGKPLSEFAGIFKLPLDLYVGKPGDQLFSGAVAILVGPRSASSAEVFAAGMQESRRATIIGSPTCGCVLGIAKPRVMKGGGVLELSEVLWFSPTGRKLEGSGITPDQPVTLTVSDLQQRRDVAVQEADAILLHTAGMAQRASRQ